MALQGSSTQQLMLLQKRLVQCSIIINLLVHNISKFHMHPPIIRLRCCWDVIYSLIWSHIVLKWKQPYFSLNYRVNLHLYTFFAMSYARF